MNEQPAHPTMLAARLARTERKLAKVTFERDYLRERLRELVAEWATEADRLYDESTTGEGEMDPAAAGRKPVSQEAVPANDRVLRHFARQSRARLVGGG